MSSTGAERGNKQVRWGASPSSLHLHAIEHAASAVRCVIAPDVHDCDALPVLKAMDRLEQYPIRTGHRMIPLEAAVKELPQGVHGWTSYDTERGSIVVEVSRATYEGLERDAHWARLCFGYEVGHAVLHADELIQTALLAKQIETLMPFQRMQPTYKRGLDAEATALIFSEALLVPFEGLVTLKQALNPSPVDERQVAARFKVSVDTARRRVESFVHRRARLLHPSVQIFR